MVFDLIINTNQQLNICIIKTYYMVDSIYKFGIVDVAIFLYNLIKIGQVWHKNITIVISKKMDGVHNSFPNGTHN